MDLITIAALVVVGLGSAGLVALRGEGLLISALGLQWLGLILAIPEVRGGGSLLPAITEAIVALACLSILGLSSRQLMGGKPNTAGVPAEPEPAQSTALQVVDSERLPDMRESGVTEGALLWAVVLMVGIAGYGLSQLYPLGAGSDMALLLYWTLLSGVMAIVLDGTREMPKLAVGLIALTNSVALLVSVLGVALPELTAQVLFGVCRIGLAALLAYVWLLLYGAYGEHGLEMLFNSRNLTPASLIPVDSSAEGRVGLGDVALAHAIEGVEKDTLVERHEEEGTRVDA